MTNVIPLARRRATAATPSTGNTPDPIQTFADAQNALAMALHYLRQPSGNVPGAQRKTVQALMALSALRSQEGGEA